MGRRLRSMLWVRLRGSLREFFVESVEAIYSSASGHLASDGGHFACGVCCVCAAASVGTAAGGLSDDPGADILSGSESGGDGFVGDGSTGAAVRADTGAEPDDFDEFGRRQRDYAAVLAGGEHRRCAAGRAGGDQCGVQLSAEGPAESAGVQQGESGGRADYDAVADERYFAAAEGGRPGGHSDRAEDLAAFRCRAGVDQWRAEAGSADSGESDGVSELWVGP